MRTALLLIISHLSLLLMTTTAFAQELRILALGDSYTIGESVQEQDRWPLQLANMLNNQGINTAKPEIIARTGWTSMNLLQAINNHASLKQFDIVTVLIGVNDQFQGIALENYATGFTAVLEKAIQLTGNNPANVLVLSIPDYSVTPFAKRFNPALISRQLDDFNLRNKTISKQHRVQYVDITDISRNANTRSELLAFDGLHPSATMYQAWANKALKTVRQMIDNR